MGQSALFQQRKKHMLVRCFLTYGKNNFLKIIACTRPLIRQPLKLVTVIRKIWDQSFLTYNWQILCPAEKNDGCNISVNSDCPMLSNAGGSYKQY